RRAAIEDHQVELAVAGGLDVVLRVLQLGRRDRGYVCHLTRRTGIEEVIEQRVPRRDDQDARLADYPENEPRLVVEGQGVLDTSQLDMKRDVRVFVNPGQIELGDRLAGDVLPRVGRRRVVLDRRLINASGKRQVAMTHVLDRLPAGEDVEIDACLDRGVAKVHYSDKGLQPCRVGLVADRVKADDADVVRVAREIALGRFSGTGRVEGQLQVGQGEIGHVRDP